MIAVSTFMVYHTDIHSVVRWIMNLIILTLLAATTYLGVKNAPFKTENVPMKMGLTQAFEDLTGAEDFQLEADDPEVLALPPTVTHTKYLPKPMDQGQCGSCWAVASSTVMSARYAKLLEEQNKEKPHPKPFTNCTPKDVDQSGWHFSPQYLLDKSERNTTQCLGKCNGDSAATGFRLAKDGVPDSKCVPYFASALNTAKMCPIECGAPSTDSYEDCTKQTSLQCVHNDAFLWETCADGKTPVKPLGESFDVKTVRGEPAMMKELHDNGPILCGVNYYPKKDGSGPAWALTKPSDRGSLFGGYSDVVSPGYIIKPESDGEEYTKLDNCEGCGGHALVIHGYGETKDGVKYWEVRNSWGPLYGSNGTSRIIRGVDAWNIESLTRPCVTASVREATNSAVL
jgi:hypothetical protein